MGLLRRRRPAAGSDRASRPVWSSEDEFSIDGTRYGCRPVVGVFRSSADRFCLRKTPDAVQGYVDLVDRLQPTRILELGVFEGGSTAMMAQLAEPEKLVGVELASERGPGLREFVERRGLEQMLAMHWGVDQADRARLADIVAAEFGNEPIDLIMDDASHLLAQTRQSFNALFPRLRPGGLFVLEDWGWAHVPMQTWGDETPLTILVFEILMACAHSPGVVAGVEVDPGWVVVSRGEDPLDPDAFDLRSACGEAGRELTAGLDRRGAEPPSAPPRSGLLRRLSRTRRQPR